MHFRIRQEQGTSLIEILVSVVVIAVGLLGLASMQINALKYQQTASQRSVAIQAAYDLADRMRANFVYTTPEQFVAERGQNEAKYTSVDTYSSKSAGTYDLPNNCGVVTPGGACTSAQVAANDLADWQRNLKRQLSGGAGMVVPVAGTTNSTFDVIVMWQEKTLETTDASCPDASSAPVGVRCYRVRISI